MKNLINVLLLSMVLIFVIGCTPAIIQSSSCGLPVVLIDTADGKKISSRDTYVPGTFEFIDGTLENSMQVALTKDGFRGRGNSTWGLPKDPYLIKFDSKESVFGMPSHKRWVLLANYYDKSLLRNDFAFTLGNEIYDNLEWTPSFVHVELFINGEYKGLYQLAEDKKPDKNRINIDKTAEGKDFLIELNGHEKEDGEIYFTSEEFKHMFSIKDPETEEAKEYAKTIINNFEAALAGSDFLNPSNGYASHIDVPSFIDWYLVNEITKNKDARSFSSIFVYYRKKENKIYMGPVWDFDRSAGVDTIPDLTPEGFHIQLKPSWYERLFQDVTFKNAVRARWDDTKDEVWEAIEDLTLKGKVLRRAANANFTRYNVLNKFLLPSWAKQPGTYDGEVEALVTWLKLRYEWLDNNL